MPELELLILILNKSTDWVLLPDRRKVSAWEGAQLEELYSLFLVLLARDAIDRKESKMIESLLSGRVATS